MQLPNIFIVGPSGSGKSTALRNLDPNSTAILNINRKALPFRQAIKFKYNKMLDSYTQVVEELRLRCGIDPAIETIVVDDFTSVDESILIQCRSSEKGFAIYSKHNQEVVNIINSSLLLSDTKVRQDKTEIKPKWIIWTGIDEIRNIPQPDGSNKAAKSIKVEGRELQGWIETKFTVVLFTEVLANKMPGQSGNFEYKFLTNSDGVTSAKTPMGLFKDRYVDNDVAMVIRELKNYYGIN